MANRPHVNITNVCISGCKFCNFHCKPHQTERAYVTTIEQYAQKFEETLALGGDQLLLQGRPCTRKLGIDFLRNPVPGAETRYPQIRLHALGAPEVFHIARISGLDTETTLRRLVDAGLDSLPGAGAEYLDNGLAAELSRPATERRPMARRHAHRAPPRPGDLGDDDVRPRRNTPSACGPPAAHPRPAGPLSRRTLRLSGLHPLDFFARRAPNWSGRELQPAFHHWNTFA